MRAPGRFVYYRGGLAAPAALAVSEAVAFANPNEPTALHAALTGRAGELRVSWVSANTSAVTQPLLRWGFDAAASLARVPATTKTYTATDVCQDAPDVPDKYAGTPGAISAAAGKGFMAPGELHSAVMSALPSASARQSFMFYAVGSDATGWSDVQRMALPPAPGAPVRFAAAADVGSAEVDGSNIVHGNPAAAPYGQRSYFSMAPSLNTSAALAAEVAQRGAQLVLHNGDLAYAMGYSALWDVFFERMAGATAGAPYMTAVGNHEHNWPRNPYSGRFNESNLDSGGECGVPYAARFPMPPPADASPATPWYSFDFGAVHFTTISTEHPFEPGTPQYAFVVADLAAAAAARDAAVLDASGGGASAPRWLVMNGHRPFYADSTYNTGPASDGVAGLAMAGAFSPLWRQYGVDVTLTGHHHSYQRSFALAYGYPQSACDSGAEAGTRHVVLGHGGASFSATGGPQAGLFEVVDTARHGYVTVAATATTFTLTAMAADTGAVMDTFTLSKPAGPRACLPVASQQDAATFTNPALEDGTLIFACIISSLVAVGYGARACMQRHEEHTWEAHARAATLRMMQNCEADDDEEMLAQTARDRAEAMRIAAAEEMITAAPAGGAVVPPSPHTPLPAAAGAPPPQHIGDEDLI
jgi:hypothetical protein